MLTVPNLAGMSQTFGQYGKHRLWEVIPGFLVWTIFVLAVTASFVSPVTAAVFIILFDLYWTLRVLYFLIFLTAAYREYKKAMHTPWMEKLRAQPDWGRLYHAVFLPTANEDVAIVRDALRALKESTYENEKFLVVIGGEARNAAHFHSVRTQIEQEFSNAFGALLFTEHPADLPGEIIGKGSNMKWMAGKFHELVTERQIPEEDIIVSAFDVDTIAHREYFAYLAYLYLTEPNPTHRSYQPVVLFSNNIWEASAPVRIAAFGTTFWLLAELVRPERLWTFSSHSMPWKMLRDVGYWEPDLVSEDSRIFLQGFIRYDGDYAVTPVFLPVHMDAVTGGTYWESLKALYKQQRRWAWGVEHLPYMLEKFKSHPQIPRRKKVKYIFNHIEGMFTWATAPMLIFMLGYLPFFVAGDASATLITNSPFTLQLMMQVATLGVFASAILSLPLLPKRPGKKGPWNWLVMILQWALLPVTFIVFGAFPAIDAQTRLMLGKYLGFNVTEKKR